MSCSTVWGVQDGRIYSVINKSVQRLSSMGHEITCCPSPFLSFNVAILPTTYGRLRNYGVCMCSHSPTPNRTRLHNRYIIDDVNMHKDYWLPCTHELVIPIFGSLHTHTHWKSTISELCMHVHFLEQLSGICYMYTCMIPDVHVS